MRLFKGLTLGLFAAALSVPVASNAEQSINPWTDCGIGAMIFSNTKPAAAISNVIWDLGSTAVTSAGVSENTCSGKTEVSAALFINKTYASLEEETVKGSGQHLHAMLDIVGCESSSHQKIINAVRADFSNTLSAEGYLEKSTADKAENYYSIVFKNVAGEFSGQCQVI